MLAEHVATHGTTGKDRGLLAGQGDDPPQGNLGRHGMHLLTAHVAGV